ncbi:hypothetical protein QTO05_05620 [Vibrio fortis]|uniref:hypothetical protein n=1 Tax=Vibrio fortis TaxID=212667 RepID=UPI002F3F4417
MIKIFAKVLTALFIILVIGAVGMGILAFYGMGKSAEQDVIAQTYIKKVVLSFDTSDLSEFKGFLHPQVVANLETNEGEKFINLISTLGPIKAIEDPKWISSKSTLSTSDGQYQFSNYEVQATFENGKGLIKLSTIPDRDGYLVTNFQVFSDYFSTLQYSE